MSLTKESVRLLRDSLDKFLSDFETVTGFKATVGHGRFSADSVVFKVELGRVGADGQANTQAADAFRQLAGLYGLQADDLGRQFRLRGEQFVITGASHRSRKYPILARSVSTGRGWKFPPDAVRRALEAPPPPASVRVVPAPSSVSLFE